GYSGKLVVNDVEYDNVMPAMSHLADETIAEIGTFILNSWNNPGGSFTPEQVAAVRAALAVPTDPAQGETHPSTANVELSYKGAPSAVPAEEARVTMSPGGPELTADEMKQATRSFFERCAGCHGVLRKGATGKPLTPDLTRPRGTEYLKAL